MTMRIDIYWRGAALLLGTLLLISVCHSARLTGSQGTTGNGSELITSDDDGGDMNGIDAESKAVDVDSDDDDGNGVITGISQRAGRCFGTIKRWLGLEDEDLRGNPDDVRFFLYPNPLDKLHTEEIVFGDPGTVQRSSLGVGQQLKLVIHGWTKSYETETAQIIKNAYLAQMIHDPSNANLNIVLVDWEPIANPKVPLELFSYKYAVSNVEVVGKRVGEFVQFLMENGALKSLRDVHIIGFSLGAHIAGAAGNTLKQFNAGQVPSRVTGLDPAGPAFYEGLKYAHRSLHKTDGRFVDVIHTSMGVYGTVEPMGHADFYPNGGGPIQHRCEVEYDHREAHGMNNNSTLSRLAEVSSCSHGKAPEYFALSVLDNHMIGCRCESYLQFKMGCDCREKAILGEFCDPRSRGHFYLDI